MIAVEPHPPKRTYGAVIAAAAVCAAFFAVDAASRMSVGPLSHHMAQHIFLMNALAPLAALGVAPLLGERAKRTSFLVLATAAQVILLWAWHAPPMLNAAYGGWLAALMHASLFASALAFWVAVFAPNAARRWMSIVAVLVTGKLFCLLGALFVFAPRALFASNVHAGHHGVASSLEDQQLAGLMMVAACPLTYVLAGVVLAARWLDSLEVKGATARPIAAWSAR